MKHNGGGIKPVRWKTDTECKNRCPSRIGTLILQVSVEGGLSFSRIMVLVHVVEGLLISKKLHMREESAAARAVELAQKLKSYGRVVTTPSAKIVFWCMT